MASDDLAKTALSHMNINSLRPSAVDSITPVKPGASACSVPVFVSRARLGYWLAILPNSEICKRCRVVDRKDRRIKIVELLLNASSLVLSLVCLICKNCLILSSNSSHKNLVRSNSVVASASPCAIIPSLKCLTNKQSSKKLTSQNVEIPCCRDLSIIIRGCLREVEYTTCCA